MEQNTIHKFSDEYIFNLIGEYLSLTDEVSEKRKADINDVITATIIIEAKPMIRKRIFDDNKRKDEAIVDTIAHEVTSELKEELDDFYNDSASCKMSSRKSYLYAIVCAKTADYFRKYDIDINPSGITHTPKLSAKQKKEEFKTLLENAQILELKETKKRLIFINDDKEKISLTYSISDNPNELYSYIGVSERNKLNDSEILELNRYHMVKAYSEAMSLRTSPEKLVSYFFNAVNNVINDMNKERKKIRDYNPLVDKLMDEYSEEYLSTYTYLELKEVMASALDTTLKYPLAQEEVDYIFKPYLEKIAKIGCENELFAKSKNKSNTDAQGHSRNKEKMQAKKQDILAMDSCDIIDYASHIKSLEESPKRR